MGSALSTRKAETAGRCSNLGFVLNVIEDPEERKKGLTEAFQLTKELLVVSVMHENQANNSNFRLLGDGILTSRGTFQKYYSQEEIQQYIEQTLEVEPIAISLGIFYVFKSDEVKQSFIVRSVQRNIDWQELSTRERPEYVPRLSKYQKNQSLFDTFWQTCLSLGRVPRRGEFQYYDEIRQVAGSLPKALKILGERFDLEALEEARRSRAEDLLVYFCMAQFRKRIPFKLLPEGLQYDIKAIFGNYTCLREEAFALLMEAGKPESIVNECEGIGFGRHDEEFFQFHSSYISSTAPI